MGAEDVLSLDQHGTVEGPHGEAVGVWGGRGGGQVGIFELSDQLDYLFIVFGSLVTKERGDRIRGAACCHGIGAGAVDA